MTVFERIDKIVKEKGIVPSKMMKDLGFSNGLYSQWRSGSQKPSSSKIVAIAEYLDVPVDYFFSGESVKRGLEILTEYVETSGFINGRAAGHSHIRSFDLTENIPDTNDIKDVDEPIPVKMSEDEWSKLIDGLSDESLVQLRDYTRYLLWKQDQASSD